MLSTNSAVEVINVGIARVIKCKALAGWKAERLGKLHTTTGTSLLQREIGSCALEKRYHPSALCRERADSELMCMIHIPSQPQGDGRSNFMNLRENNVSF